MLADENAALGSIVTEFNKVITDTATKPLGKQCQKKKPRITDEIFDCCDQSET